MTQIFNFPINFNSPPKITFRGFSPQTIIPLGQPAQTDDFRATNPLSGGVSAEQIEATAKSNPRIKEISQKYNIPIKANIEELNKLNKGHLLQTRIVAANIYSNLPADLKREVNLSDVQKAAMYHDYGKVLIPDSVLNKPDKLNLQEQEIMQQHSELGYELLKNKGLNEHTLDLIKYHHQTNDGQGYPEINNGYIVDIDLDILRAADEYTALREERSYKPAMSHEEALAVIKEQVDNGNMSQEVYDALSKIRV